MLSCEPLNLKELMTDSKPSFGNRLSNLLTGRFLINPKVIQQWPFILFLCFLALIMTASSHSAERKVHRIASLRSEMKELHSEFIDTRSELMSESMETQILKRVEEEGLKLQKSKQAPIIIKAEDE